MVSIDGGDGDTTDIDEIDSSTARRRGRRSAPTPDQEEEPKPEPEPTPTAPTPPPSAPDADGQSAESAVSADSASMPSATQDVPTSGGSIDVGQIGQPDPEPTPTPTPEPDPEPTTSDVDKGTSPPSDSGTGNGGPSGSGSASPSNDSSGTDGGSTNQNTRTVVVINPDGTRTEMTVPADSDFSSTVRKTESGEFVGASAPGQAPGETRAPSAGGGDTGETVATGTVSGQGIETGGPGSGGNFQATVDGETVTGSKQDIAQAAETAFLEDNPQFTDEDVRVVESDTGLAFELTASGETIAFDEAMTDALNRRAAEGNEVDFEAVDSDVQNQQQSAEGVAIDFEEVERIADQQRQAEASIERDIEAAVGSQRAEIGGVVNPTLRGGVIEATDLDRGTDFTIDSRKTADGVSFDAELTETFKRQERTRAAERLLEQEIASETGEFIDLTEADIMLEGDQATLSKSGRKKLSVEQSELVQLTEGTPLEPAARGGAGLDFDFEEFRRENRGQFFESVDAAVASGIGGLSGIKVRNKPTDEFTTLGEISSDLAASATGASGPIKVRRGPTDEFRTLDDVAGDVQTGVTGAADAAFPDFEDPLVQDPIEAAESLKADTEEFLSEFDAEKTGKRLVAAGAVGLAGPQLFEPTSTAVGGSAVLAGGALLAGTAAVAAAERVTRPGELDVPSVEAPTIAAAAEGEVTESERGEMIIDRPVIIDDQGEITIPDEERGRIFFPPEEGALPPEQAPPELELPIEDVKNREAPGDELVFPRDKPLPIQEDPIFLPEVLVPTAPKSQFTSGRFTPPEVPVDATEPTEPFGGPEVPIDDSFEGQERAEDFLFPGPEIPGVDESFEDFPQPDTTLEAEQQQILKKPEPQIVRDPADIARDTGPAGPAFIKRSPSRVSDEFLLQTPTADIDLSLVDPELARFLRQQRGAETAELDAFEGISERSPQRPAERVTPIGRSDQLADALAGIRAASDLGFSDALAPSLDDVTAQDTTPRMAERNVPRTTTTPRFATPTTPGTDVGPGFEFPGLEVTIDTPFVTTPGFGTPSGRGLRGLDPDLEQGQEEDTLLDPDFFSRATEEEPGDPDAILTALDKDFGAKTFDSLTEGL